MQQKEYLGIENLEEILLEEKPERIFLVSGKKSYEISGARNDLSYLSKRYEITRYSKFENNPKIEDVKRGLEEFRKNKYDLIIAVGGGSVLDMAKLIGILSAQKGKILEYVKDERDIENKGTTLIAIPTTSGSGSEAIHSGLNGPKLLITVSLYS